MSPKHFLRTAFATALLATGLAAQAGTVNFTGSPIFGSYNPVGVSVSGFSYTGGPAGGFKVTLSGFGDAAFDGQAFEAYCVDVSEYIANPSGNYALLTASSYFGLVHSANPILATDKLSALGKLISYVNGTNLLGTAGDKDQQSTALQLAIWNIVYDTDSTLTGGSMKETTSNFRTSTGNYVGADVLLSQAQSYTGGPSYDLYVLSSGKPINTTSGFQDQLIWKAAPQRRDLPEPASLALVALALGGAGLASRRRRA